ncbi:LPS export ABC transporter periplasmic protein LptC [Mesorhizobium sp. B1-1-4]|uniref:LPS export ABC transporter periplasmic protein LptC n=1 Tax=Mesorhizobium sp. B1-1-4 TaxID=2589980 RepID=UPI00112AD6EA|nr:LPS export ABC transporter periplasmic protein LptC [Mesorhizobium sp. B1-1-4]TPN49101.1 LPS export ABC transporter periplasmic protein LptC [Mesorhizobium sp. B1-1-4]
MLARTSEASSTETELAPPADGPARGDAFDRARRHSRRVRVLKFAVPVLAALIAIAFPVYSYLAAPVSVAVQAEGTAFSNGKLVMANPKLNGFTKQKLPYSMTALRAIQDVSTQGIIELDGIDAKVPIAADNVAAIKATHGTYDREGNTMHLTSDVTIATTDGLQARFKSVFLDMGKGTMKTDNPVDVSRDGSQITANSLSVQDNGKVLVFENKVRVNIDPANLKAAEAKGEEANVAH